MFSRCKNSVGMLDVGSREVLHARLEGCKGNDDLRIIVSKCV